MRKKLLSGILSVAMVLSLFASMPLTASANGPTEQFNSLVGIIYQNESIWGVSNDPQVATTFTVTSPTLITGIRNYHWNATSPNEYESATFKLVHSDGTEYGPWALSAEGGSGRENVYWYAFPNVVIKPGEYTLVDSNNATWSWTTDTGGKGHTTIKGMASPAITDLVIEDAIAPINGEAPVTAIAETDQYTGTIAWAGNPSVFAPNINYTATITLTAKDGYSFDGIGADEFSVPCAATASNAENSGVITATFVSPPDGYITDGNGVVAYRYSNTAPIDIKGFHGGSWLQTTYADYGYRFYYLLDECTDFSNAYNQQEGLIIYNQPVPVPESNLTVSIVPSFANNGKAVKITYQLKNNGSESEIISIAGGSDVQIGNNDGAPMTRLNDGRGFMMYNGSDQFNFFGLNTVGVTNVDTFWFGSLRYLYENYFIQQKETTISGVDSAMAYSWQNKTITPGQARNFSILIGIGGAGSEIPTEIGVNFDSQGGSDVDTIIVAMAGDTISAPADPTRSGYTFDGWYTEPECTNKFNFSTPITATITLYAKWVQDTPSGSKPSTPKKYPVTESGEDDQDGGQTKFDKSRAKAGETVVISVEPDLGYEGGVPDVLDDKGNPVDVTDNGDGTYSFVMPIGGVTVKSKFSRIKYFDDVDEDDWFDEASWYCAAHGLFKGTAHRHFEGQMGTSRAMLVTVLHRLAEGEDNLESIFDDVASGKWYTEAIGWGEHNGIVEGYGDGRFGPDDGVTREQLVSVLYRYTMFKKYGITDLAELDAFDDADAVAEWALEPMKWAVGNGLIEGMGNGLISPKTGATRAQFASIMQRYVTAFVK